ncbi:MAG: GAF domain-containing protein [Ignavibacteria bacterium]|nr:GAF domain-containing protein [Ignavibacteria bacterium]
MSKEQKYKTLIDQIRSLTSDESDLIANLSNVCSVLKYGFDYYFWVGFYFLRDDELVLGPFQGPVACTRIKIPNGVCGESVRRNETIIVPDVHKFPGHIACNSESKSEIVVPLSRNGKIKGVLDIDSDSYNMFDETDKIYLEELRDYLLSLNWQQQS